MSVKNRFAATSEQDAEDQLKALYCGKPVRTGSTAHHRMTWFIKSRQVTMARASSHRNGRGEPMYLVEVK
ncbi:hypothetical protein J0692_22700 [Vibrio alginolyticus]|uniref:hypothetical protein n=1 Tax=Vibrio alginolyticus TaxID=663 RepID=UPI001A904D4C|nr:hypothetical protein [Vibrio alginolyticus]MBO0165062.1 hypothetical protein [Vibrio alginolyticus]